MHPFEQTISVVIPIALAIVGAVIILNLYFRLAAWFGGSSSGEGRPTRFRGVVDKKTRVTVHLANGISYENVLLVGFVQSGTPKAAIPLEWRSLVILEDPEGRRFLFPAKLLKLIEVPPRGDH